MTSTTDSHTPAPQSHPVRNQVAGLLRDAVRSSDGGAAPDAWIATAWSALDATMLGTRDATLCRFALEQVAGHSAIQQAMARSRAALPDVVAELGEVGLAPELLRWAIESWAAALDRRVADDRSSLSSAHGLLVPHLAVAQSEWPLPVAHPLDRLVAQLAGEQAVPAYLYLRDTAEGAIRVMWSALLWDGLCFLESRADGLAGLSERSASSLRVLLDHMVGGTFSMGAAVHVMLGADTHAEGALAALGAELPPDSASAALAALVAEQPTLANALRRLAGWRNADPGHGTLGREARLLELLTGRSTHKPVADLAVVLETLGLWLGALQRIHSDWPSLTDARVWKSSGEREGIPAPIAFRDRAPLLLTERFVPGALQLRDVLGGERRNHRYEAFPVAIAERLARTLPGAGPLDLSSRDEEEALQLAGRLHQDRQVDTPLLATLLAQLSASSGWQAVVGPAGTGKSFLLRQLLDHLADVGSLPEREGRWRSLHFSAVPGTGFAAGDIAFRFNQQLHEAGVTFPRDARGARLRLTTDATEAAQFWEGLLAHPDNHALRLVVVVDGLDEMHGDGERRGLELLPRLTASGGPDGSCWRAPLLMRIPGSLEHAA